MLVQSLLYDKLKKPFIGHALDELLYERNSKYFWSGSYSFQSEKEYKKLKFFDNSVSEEEKEIDPITGDPKNQTNYYQISSELPTYDEILERHKQMLEEYDSYSDKRERVYPAIAEQLDMLYKDIDSGKLGQLAKDSMFYKTINEIKKEHK
jgi:hypothetical protein